MSPADESPMSVQLVCELNAATRVVDNGTDPPVPCVMVPTDLVARICYQFGIQDATLARLRADLVKATTPRRRRRPSEAKP